MYYKYLGDFADITTAVTLEGEKRFSWTIAAVVLYLTYNRYVIIL